MTSAPQALPSLSSTTPTPSIFSTVLAACTGDAEKLVASALLVASTLQKHLGLLERIEAGKSLRLADGSPLLGLLEKVAHLVLANLSLATSAQIPDILDTHFLLQTLLRLKKGGANLAEIYSPEVSQHEGLGADLAQLEGEVKVAAFADQESRVCLPGTDEQASAARTRKVEAGKVWTEEGGNCYHGDCVDGGLYDDSSDKDGRRKCLRRWGPSTSLRSLPSTACHRPHGGVDP